MYTLEKITLIDPNKSYTDSLTCAVCGIPALIKVSLGVVPTTVNSFLYSNFIYFLCDKEECLNLFKFQHIEEMVI